MFRSNENSRIAAVIRLLYQPVPYLPEMSFLNKGKNELRKRQALARLRDKSPQERKLRGNIELEGKGKVRICGHSVEITETTWIFGDIRNGVIAEMTLVSNEDSFIAKRIVII